MSSVKLVRVAERRVVWALSVEMWDCVWEAMAEREGAGCCCFVAVDDGRVVFR